MTNTRVRSYRFMNYPDCQNSLLGSKLSRVDNGTSDGQIRATRPAAVPDFTPNHVTCFQNSAERFHFIAVDRQLYVVY